MTPPPRLSCADCDNKVRLVHLYPVGNPPSRSHPVNLAIEAQATPPDALREALTDFETGETVQAVLWRYADQVAWPHSGYDPGPPIRAWADRIDAAQAVPPDAPFPEYDTENGPTAQQVTDSRYLEHEQAQAAPPDALREAEPITALRVLASLVNRDIEYQFEEAFGKELDLVMAALAASPSAAPLDVERLRCGQCGNDLLLSEIEGHLNSEGRTQVVTLDVEQLAFAVCRRHDHINRVTRPCQSHRREAAAIAAVYCAEEGA